MVGSAFLGVAGPCELRYLPVAFSGDARADFNLSRPVEYAGDEFIGTRDFITDHTDSGGGQLLHH